LLHIVGSTEIGANDFMSSLIERGGNSRPYS